jgi:hypothetical protein
MVGETWNKVVVVVGVNGVTWLTGDRNGLG